MSLSRRTGRFFFAWSLTSLVLAFAVVAFPSRALAAPLTINGNVAAQATCPDGGTPVDSTCNVNATATLNRGCRYGGQHTFDSISITNNGVLCVVSYNGSNKTTTGNVVLKSDTTILIDATSRVTAKGRGYQGALCADGAGPNAASGGKGGCSVFNSGGGGAHFGNGGRGTEDCQNFGNPNACDFPEEWEEDCGSLVGAACVATGGTCESGAGLPTVAGQAFEHSIFLPEFGAAGGDKGCLDGDGFEATDRAGDGGGRIVLFAANAAQTGTVTIHGRVTADGTRGCASINDSAGGGAGGTILVVGDQIVVGPTARVSAHGGRGGDSQIKCLSCTQNSDCEAGQTCSSGRCSPCNCTPCTSNSQCNAALGETCRDLPGTLGFFCANSSNQCTPFDPGDNENECRGTQNSGTCDDCGGGGGGGIINLHSRTSDIDPLAIFDVRGAGGGICPICAGEAGGGAGELQIDGGYAGEVCDGWDNDFNGTADDGLLPIVCPDGSTIPSCVLGIPQSCDYSDPTTCLVPASDARPRFTIIVDTSGSMLNDLAGVPTFGDGSVLYPGVDTASDADAVHGNNSRLFIAKNALTDVISAFPESDYALARYYQDVGVNRSCQTASNFECAQTCCSYDDPRDNVLPVYPSTYPGNTCILSSLYPGSGYPATADFTSNIEIGWLPEMGETPATSDCINYAGSCGPPRRGAQVVVGFNQNINNYLSWLDGTEDADNNFDPSTIPGNHCSGNDCELRGTGPTPLAGSLEATYDYLLPVVSCDAAIDCRSYSVILLTDGAESCQGNAATAAGALFTGIAGKRIRTYVIGFSVLASEQASLNAIAAAGGTTSAFFANNENELANALAQIIGQNQVFELCNGDDDDCDTLVDEDFPELGLPCTDGELGICLGTGELECTADGSGTECVLTDPGDHPVAEECNGLDDDCDGMIDEADDGTPLPCPNCIATPEICDGIDNDCDLAIDEQGDVEENQPDIYGVDCGILTAPNDQPPCQFGTVLCINAMPVCVGYKGPKEEICNGQDDDCDGIGDDMAACPGDTQCVEGQCVLPCAAGEFPCPSGYDCVEGFCFSTTCDGGCDPGEVCQDGRCVPTGEGGGGAGEGGSGGEPATGGGATGGSPSDGGSDAGGNGSGGAPSDGGAGGDRGTWGLTTGGGGCSCSTTGTSQGRTGWLFAAAVAIAFARSRRSVARKVSR